MKIKMISSRLLAGLLVGASLVAMAVSVSTQVNQQEADQRQEEADQQRARYEACSDEIFNQLLEVLVDTRDVGASERRTTREFYEDIRDNPRGFPAKIDAHLKKLAQAEAARQASPLPLPPRVACRA